MAVLELPSRLHAYLVSLSIVNALQKKIQKTDVFLLLVRRTLCGRVLDFPIKCNKLGYHLCRVKVFHRAPGGNLPVVRSLSFNERDSLKRASPKHQRPKHKAGKLVTKLTIGNQTTPDLQNTKYKRFNSASTLSRPRNKLNNEECVILFYVFYSFQSPRSQGLRAIFPRTLDAFRCPNPQTGSDCPNAVPVSAGGVRASKGG